MCFGGRKTREQKISLKICLFGFPEVLVMGSTTMAARKVVSSSTLIGPFEFERECRWICARAQIQILRQFFRSSRFFWPPKHREFRVKFIGLHRIVGFIAIRDFSLWGESNLWKDFWPAMDGVVCLSIILEGEVTVSKNSTKRRQNGFKISTRDKFATQLR